MKIFKLLLLLFISNLVNFSYSQENCNCASDFTFIVDKMEQEHPGFKWNVTKNSAEKYKKLKDSIYLNLSGKESYKQLCVKKT
jgi:hypothetical protein